MLFICENRRRKYFKEGGSSDGVMIKECLGHQDYNKVPSNIISIFVPQKQSVAKDYIAQMFEEITVPLMVSGQPQRG